MRSNRWLTKPSAKSAKPKAVFLVGFMGAGKSSVGRALAVRLGWTFEDLDERIERREGRSVPEIFRDSGEPEFRQVEHAALRELLKNLSTTDEPKVIALGGGTFAQRDSHEAIQGSGISTVFLDAPLGELWQRCEQQMLDAKRPLQTSKNKFRETYNARLQFYRTASVKIETGGKRIEAIAAEIIQTLGLGQNAVRPYGGNRQ